MEALPSKPSRKPRADALRNRDRLLAAARLVFSAGRPDASLEAVYRHEVDQLSDYADALKIAEEPVAALRLWLHANVQLVATKKGMLAALALAAHAPSELYAYSFERLTMAVGSLLQGAVATGELRADVTAQELLRTLIGMCYLHDQPGWQATVIRLVDVFVDGLRTRKSGSD